MAFPAPATGVHTEGGRDFQEHSGKWAESMRSTFKWFTSVGDSDPTYQWIPIKEATKIIKVHIFTRTNAVAWYDLGFIAHDGSNTINFEPGMVTDSQVIHTWGGSGIRTKDWNSVRAYSGGTGIPLNWSRGTAHVKGANFSFTEIKLIATVGRPFGTNLTGMHWINQIQSEDDGEKITWGFVCIRKPIGAFRKMGYKATRNIDNGFVGITYF